MDQNAGVDAKDNSSMASIPIGSSDAGAAPTASNHKTANPAGSCCSSSHASSSRRPPLTLDQIKAQDRKQLMTFAIIFVVILTAIAAGIAGVVVGVGRQNANQQAASSILDDSFQAPTPMPTSPETHKACFTSLDDLRTAIRYYRLDPDNATLADEYGSPIGAWCITPLTSLRQLLDGISTFNYDVSAWDTSNVMDMSSAFSGAADFNQPLNDWNVSACRDFSYMFYGAAAFDMPLSAWQTHSATDMSSMFANAVKFNQDISTWNTSLVDDFDSMFSGASRFNISLKDWQVGSAVSMRSMFAGASRFDHNLCRWGRQLNDTTAVSDMFMATSCGFGSDAELMATPEVTSDPKGPFCYSCT